MIFASVSYTNFKLALLLCALHAGEQSARVSCLALSLCCSSLVRAAASAANTMGRNFATFTRTRTACQPASA